MNSLLFGSSPLEIMKNNETDRQTDAGVKDKHVLSIVGRGVTDNQSTDSF